MWMLSFVPDSLLAWIVNAILVAGIIGTCASFIARFIPFVAVYRSIIQTVGIVLLVIGVYLKGGYSVEMEWRSKVAELEAKVAKSEAESKEANARIETKIIEKIKIVKEQTTLIQEKIKNVEVKIDSQCKVAPEAIDILNEAAELKK